jgi:hypothetical protein
MFDVVRQAFLDEALLPTFDGKYVKAEHAKLARAQELRELFGPRQIATLFGLDTASWLSDEITDAKAPSVRKYLMSELNIDEIRPERMIALLNEEFLEVQPDEWISQLYGFLNGQGKSTRVLLNSIPLIRLEDGSHVIARENGQANAFLPGAFSTSFPTIRRALFSTPEVRLFLLSLDLTEPDPVDDVIWNILPKYQQDEVDADDTSYAEDIERIRSAFSTDSTKQKEKLRSALRDTTFVMVVARRVRIVVV